MLPLLLSRLCRKDSGFTLLEIMIALAIVGIAMVSLLGLANRSIQVHDRLQRITEATFLAQQLMAETEVKANNGSLIKTETQGVFSHPNESFHWRVIYNDTPLPSVQMVTVTVFWGDEARNEFVDLASFIF